jgi:hypothetical protein
MTWLIMTGAGDVQGRGAPASGFGELDRALAAGASVRPAHPHRRDRYYPTPRVALKWLGGAY